MRSPTPRTKSKSRPATRKQAQTKLQHPPRYAVVLHNDPINSFGYVVRMLMKVFFYRRAKAYWLTLKAHCVGRSRVWTGTFEIAETKAYELRACGPDPDRVADGAQPLTVSVEALAR